MAISTRRRPSRDPDAAMTERMERIARESIQEAQRPRTEQERVTAEILDKLDELGGRAVGEDDLTFEGTRFVLPESMRGNITGPGGVVEFLSEWDEQQNTPFGFTRAFPYRPWDGAAAFNRAMMKVFGTTGIGRATFFSPPEYRTVPSGPRGETIQVPWGLVSLSLLEATFILGATMSEEYGIEFQIQVQAPRRHRKRIEGFFNVIEDELRTHSIYKGHAITANPNEPEFLDTTLVDPSKVIYRQDVLTQLNVNMWSPIKHADELRRRGIPLKRAVLLEGPNGTGKTLAGNLTSALAEKYGWTFILVRAGDDPFEALNTAKMYAPAVVWVEDLERFASAKKDNEEITRLLDALDNVQGKGTEIMAGFTSNFADKLVKDVVRPGRLDAIITVAELDAAGYEKLIKALVPEDLLDKNVDFARVVAAYLGEDAEDEEDRIAFLPSFATEAIQKAVRYSIARNDGHAKKITTDDLVESAHGMRTHLRLMNRALTRGQERPVLDTVFHDAIAVAATDAVSKLLLENVKLVDTYGDDMATVAKKNGRR